MQGTPHKAQSAFDAPNRPYDLSWGAVRKESILGWPGFPQLLWHWLKPLTFDFSSGCTNLTWKSAFLVVLDHSDLQGFPSAFTAARPDQPFVLSNWKITMKHTRPSWSPVFFLVPVPLPFLLQHLIVLIAHCDWLWGNHTVQSQQTCQHFETSYQNAFAEYFVPISSFKIKARPGTSPRQITGALAWKKASGTF